jgi:hypothetical protein
MCLGGEFGYNINALGPRYGPDIIISKSIDHGPGNRLLVIENGIRFESAARTWRVSPHGRVSPHALMNSNALSRVGRLIRSVLRHKGKS